MKTSSRDDRLELRDQLYDKFVLLIDQRIKAALENKQPNDRTIEFDMKRVMDDLWNLTVDEYEQF